VQAKLDHLVFGSASLEQGAAWLEKRLCAQLQPGGKHALMGTHNRLLRIGELSYLELIAIDPDAEKPSRPRWFGLDKLTAENGEVRLLTWAASVVRLSECQPSYDAGQVLPMTRGALSWHITVQESGNMPDNGVLPALIEWPAGVHPAAALPQSEVSLERLELLVPDQEPIAAALDSICLSASANKIHIRQDKAGPRLRVELRTPAGRVHFESGG